MSEFMFTSEKTKKTIQRWR